MTHTSKLIESRKAHLPQPDKIAPVYKMISNASFSQPVSATLTPHIQRSVL